MSETSLLDRLAAEFPKSEVRQRSGGGGIKLDYIDVVQTINRLTDVLGASWDWRVDDARVEIVDQDGPKYLAYERGHLTVRIPGPEEGTWTEVVRGGSGADVDARDPDKAIKTADAEALKKAGHKFGIALYLWDEEKRDAIAKYRQYQRGTLAAIKSAALKEAGDLDGLMKAIGVDNAKDEKLQDREVLLEYLAAA